MTPPGSTQVTINRLSPGTTYEFQVVGKNTLGDGMLSKVVTVRTLGKPNSRNRTLDFIQVNLMKTIFLNKLVE